MARKKSSKKTKKNRKLRLKLFAGLAIIILAIFLLAALFANVVYGEKIYPKIQIAGINVGNQSRNDAQKIISDRVEEYLKSNPEFILDYEKKNWRPNFTDLGGEINIDETIEAAFYIGHGENFFLSALRQIQSVFSPINIDLKIKFHEKDFSAYLKPIKESLETPYENDSYKIENLKLIETSGKEGNGIDEMVLKNDINQLIQKWQDGKVKIIIRTTYPKVRRENCYQAKEMAELAISEPITLKYKNDGYKISQELIASWVVFSEDQIDEEEIDPFSPNVSDHFKLKADLSDNSIKEYARSIAEEINTLPVNARLQFVNGKLKILKKSIPGTFLDEKSLIADLKEIVKVEGERIVKIKTSKLSSEINEKNLSKLGIKELLSTGISDFSGSPNNRRHNIAIGASMFNGVIVKPGEDFSFVETLGDVSAKTGYLPELVIKEDKTIPEYGGGLCQVSTTAFRAAVLSGLPILEREPHSYRVKYYDWPYGPGFDSTVYIPHPDLKFKNDTSAHILIQTYVSGSRLYFEFYGTKGNRRVKIDGPRVIKYLSGGALKTEFYQLVYQGKKLIRKVRFYSFYDRPDKYHQEKPKPKPAPKPTTKPKPKPTEPPPTEEPEEPTEPTPP